MRVDYKADRAEAGEHLNEALKAIYANVGPSPVLVEIRAAMKLLGVKETHETH